MILSKWKLLAFFVLYYFVSMFLLVITAGGWSSFFTPFFASFAFYWPFGVALLAATLLLALRGQKDVRLSKVFLLSALLLQLLILLLNVSDCGDSSGTAHFFYERLMGATCETDHMYPLSGVAASVSNIAIALYMGIFYVELYLIARSPKDLPALVQSIPKRVARFVAWCVMFVTLAGPLLWILYLITDH